MNKKKILGIVFGVFALSQLIPVDKTNPPSNSEIVVEKEVKLILKRACYDCHSNKTIWPAYSKIFPISFAISKHVKNGREELNFSEWEAFTAKKKNKKASEVIEEIESGDMPPPYYKIFHSNSKLNQSDIQVLKNWALKIEKDFEKEKK
ncbi:MAG: heme-binding domain-containing protein [Leptospiraceae bacterium]|nr:heme-binding domain-containing protein [Leptospiraceae bacterium]